jgi:hypothetical protein
MAIMHYLLYGKNSLFQEKKKLLQQMADMTQQKLKI